MNGTTEKIAPSKGFEIAKNNVRLSLKMHFQIFLICLVMFLFATGYWFFKEADKGEAGLVFRYYWAQNFGVLPDGGWGQFQYHGDTYRLTNKQMLAIPEIGKAVEAITEKFGIVLLWKGSVCFAGVVLIYISAYFLFGRMAKKAMAPKHIRGTELVTEWKMRLKVWWDFQPHTFTIGKLRVAVNAETQSILLAGAAGSGKTQTMYPMIKAVQQMNRRGAVYDHKGDFTAKTYRRGRDLIWNPLDERSVKWTLFNDISSMQDVHKMAHSMLPDVGEKGATGHFRHAARDLFIACLLHCWQNGKRTNRELWKVLSAPIDELLRLFGESVLTERGAVHIQDAKQYAQSVIGSMMPSVNIIEYMADGDFSVDAWLKENENQSLVYIVSRPDFEDFVRPALSLFIDFTGTRLLSQEDDHNRRMYFFMDEFPSLGYLPSIPKLLSTGRSKGFCGILAAQTNAQIVRHYGENVAAEIINGCATYAVYNLRDPKSAEYFADAIGKHEVEYKTESITYSVEDNGSKNGGGFAANRRIEHAVMPEELRMLPRLTAVLKLADYPNPAMVEIPLCLLPTLNPSFVERPDMELESLVEAAKRAKELSKPSGATLSHEPLKEGGLDGWLTE